MKEEYSPDGEMKNLTGFYEKIQLQRKEKYIQCSCINEHLFLVLNKKEKYFPDKIEVSRWRNQTVFFLEKTTTSKKEEIQLIFQYKRHTCQFLSLKANEGFIGSNTEVRLVCRSREYKYRSKVYQAAKNIKKQRECKKCLG